MHRNLVLKHVSLATIVVLSVSPALAADWPQFRGPRGLGVSRETGLPVVWDDDSLGWKTSLPGYGASSPIALDGRVYVTCYSGYGTGAPGEQMEDLTLHVVCARQSGGEIVWSRQVRPKLPETESVRDHGYAASTPATDGEHL